MNKAQKCAPCHKAINVERTVTNDGTWSGQVLKDKGQSVTKKVLTGSNFGCKSTIATLLTLLDQSGKRPCLDKHMLLLRETQMDTHGPKGKTQKGGSKEGAVV